MASISDVAKLANVSRSTVSLVCNNKGYVSKETREKIEKAMKELNYVPSELGRNLKKRRSNIIGIIVPDIAHPFFGTFIKYAERTLFQRGYKTMVRGTAGREDVESTFLQMLERKTMDGVIMGAHSLKVEQYLTISRPIVTLDRYLSESIPSVHINKTQAAELAASLFCEKGRKNIVQLVSSYTVPNYEKEKDLIFRKKIEALSPILQLDTMFLPKKDIVIQPKHSLKNIRMSTAFGVLIWRQSPVFRKQNIMADMFPAILVS